MCSFPAVPESRRRRGGYDSAIVWDSHPTSRRRLTEEPIGWLTTVSGRGVPSTAPVWFMLEDDGTILVFDNGGYSTSMMPGGTTYHSRAVEYAIDENAMTATLVWEFPGNFNVDSWYRDNWYNAYYGDADRLANGNVLVTAGSVGQNVGDARVFEVTKADGEVVWEFMLPPSYGVYRADRIVPPLVTAITQ